MAALTRMTIKEYVEYRDYDITTIAVAKAIRQGHRTPGIKEYEKIGGTYLLYVDIAELDTFLVCNKKPVKLHS